ncbi:glucose-6-phosphate isomerase [Candidatus Aquiluna sp. UB-MaderosW2red]|nr:glucose-6-phosphate isomerase [Candidatus Aquiluna sp. UB-MaderosW2red]SCX12052.1 glucose-6-phosphate isomerase [Candidatus Aquiluna sp. UB-MaderosW2red]
MKLQLSKQLENQLLETVKGLIGDSIASRIRAKDSSIWGSAAESEARNRLGWVESSETSLELIPEILILRDEFRALGLNRVVLCGMGGSSLAPEVITKTSNVALTVLDSTAPDQVAAALNQLATTVVVVSSKSGSTLETDSQKRAFETAFRSAGIDPKTRIVIVTDPGSPLDLDSREAGYRVFNADPNVGGRYSALTAFGLVPSGLAGADIAGLIASAARSNPTLVSDSLDNPGLWLGAALARSPGVNGNKDKFLIESDGLAGFGDWVEQLVAESTGKEQKGILPVALTASAPEIKNLGSDTLLIKFSSLAPGIEDITFSGNLGELFLLWEYATVIAGYLMQINPFDQPNVESAKIASRALLDSPTINVEADFVDGGISAKSFGFELVGSTLKSAVDELLEKIQEGSYVAIQVYLNRPEYPQFVDLRDLMAARTLVPVTFGWGPRFLHSTGQYHKGGPRQGVFLIITGNHGMDLEIEGRPFTFGNLISSQAQGDARVLAENGLPVLTLDFEEPLSDLARLVQVIGK